MRQGRRPTPRHHSTEHRAISLCLEVVGGPRDAGYGRPNNGIPSVLGRMLVISKSRNSSSLTQNLAAFWLLLLASRNHTTPRCDDQAAAQSRRREQAVASKHVDAPAPLNADTTPSAAMAVALAAPRRLLPPPMLPQLHARFHQTRQCAPAAGTASRQTKRFPRVADAQLRP